jgi:cell division protease FtsH
MDIQQVTRFARHMILEWGMSPRLGFVNYAGEDSREMFVPEKDYSDDTARIIDEEIKSLIDDAYADADRIIASNWEKLVAVAEALLKYETLQGEEVMRIIRGERLDKPTIAELLQAAANTAANTTPPSKSRETDNRGDEPTKGVLPSPA